MKSNRCKLMAQLPIAIISSIIVMISACGKTPKPATEQQFELSDTMLERTRFATAHTVKLRNELKMFGKIKADNNKLVEIVPVVGGYVTAVNVELGDYVEKGQTLAIIRSGEVAEYEREKLSAQSDVLLAEKNLQVARDLFNSKLTSEKDVIAAQKELEKAQAELKRITEVFSIYSLSNNAEYYVKAPISGFVVEKSINRDMQLRNDRSENIFDIAQIDEVWAVANVNESDIAKIKLGYEADVKTISYPDKVFVGKVDRIFNVLDPETRSMKVRIKMANKDYLLKPEMNCYVTLRYEENTSMIAVPAAALVFDKSKNFVMIFKDRKHIETRQVEVFRQVGDIAYIASGLSEGEKIISQNQLLIYDALND
ncbi:MAG: efflux RND transporter periplasmic adaptor subunit [Chitinophagales bacterium]